MNEDIYVIYEGQEPYLFISYSHQDSEQVEPMIHGLQDMGYRLWYDTGIAVGSRWPDTIAEHLMESNCVVAFISENAVASDYCQEELFFAMELRKPIVAVYIADTMLPPGLRMRLSARQAIYRYKFGNDSDFLKKLDKERVVLPCRTTSMPKAHNYNSESAAIKETVKIKMTSGLDLYNAYVSLKSASPIDLLINAGNQVMAKNKFSHKELSMFLQSKSLADECIDTMINIGMVQRTNNYPNAYNVIITPKLWQEFKRLFPINA